MWASGAFTAIGTWETALDYGREACKPRLNKAYFLGTTMHIYYTTTGILL